MLLRFNLFIGTLTFVAASGAMAYDYGTKATAMQNIENRPSPTQPAVRNTGPIQRHYDKAGVASLNRDEDARQARESSYVVVTESGVIRTQRASAADISYSRTSVTVHGAAVYAAPRRSSPYKRSYYATHDE